MIYYYPHYPHYHSGAVWEKASYIGNFYWINYIYEKSDPKLVLIENVDLINPDWYEFSKKLL